MWKLPKFVLILSILSILSLNTVYSETITQEFDPLLNGSTNISKPVTKIVFTKVKKQQIFSISDKKYSQEFSYFFYKMGFKRSPVTYLLFENGNLSNLNSEWQIHQFSNNLNTGVLFVFLVYENEFQLTKFDGALSGLANEVKDAVPVMNISSIDDIQIRDFVIEKDEKGESLINFKEMQNETNVKSYFANIDFKQRDALNVAIESVDVNELADFNINVKAQVKIRNNSKFDLILSDTNPLQLSFEKDSTFYNTKWATPQIPLVLNEGYIKGQSSSSFEIDLQTPILPGRVTENILLKTKEKTYDTKPISLVVKDNGQKVLKIKNTELGYLTIRKESKVDSAEVGRAPVSNVYLYTESQNNFYKIKFNDKEGWVSSRYIEVLK